jgi:membrane-associated phospholipid phosphatase
VGNALAGIVDSQNRLTRCAGSALLLVYTVLLALFGMLAWVVHFHPVLAIDVTITHLFQENQSAWLRSTIVAVSAIGNVQLLSAGLVALGTGAFWLLGLRLEAVVIAAVSVVSDPFDALTKSPVARPRHSARLVDIIAAATGNSFPSGHVMPYVAFWGLLFSFGLILFRGRSWWRITLLILSGMLVALPNQVEAEGRGPVTRFDQFTLPARIPVVASPARDGQGLRRRRTVQELCHNVPARQGERHRAVLLGLGHVEEHTRTPVVPDLGAAIGSEHQVMQNHLVSLTEPGSRSTQVVRPQVEDGVLPNKLDEEMEVGGLHRGGSSSRRCG